MPNYPLNHARPSHVLYLQIFHWISVLSVTSSGNNKQIPLHLHGATVDDYVVDDDSLLQKCEDYKSSQIDVKICISSEVDDNLSR